jgi:hypothetical protein
MENTRFPELPQSIPFRPSAHLKGARNYEIPLTHDEQIRLIDLHESRTVILNALMNIDTQQDEIRREIMKRTGIEGMIFFRNNNLF